METMPLAMMKHLEEDVPPVFMILDTYDKDVKVTRSDLHPFLCSLFYHLILCSALFCWSTLSFIDTGEAFFFWFGYLIVFPLWSPTNLKHRNLPDSPE